MKTSLALLFYSGLAVAAERPAMSDNSDVVSIVQRTDYLSGYYNVDCTDGRRQIASNEEVRSHRICLPPSDSPDTFDPRRCEGDDLSDRELIDSFFPVDT